ncbi:Protein of unknown function [Pyronema omphalodes CBS 100304]|uniref:Uncharacterized protein n=1 Tax=Pyronema omphalodes (strain CBS 100304) TaxID=1076935 RepID=U4LP38_PYROM|nr:Protein of unknown function [Pyronema omphalodes CBS 100304]
MAAVYINPKQSPHRLVSQVPYLTSTRLFFPLSTISLPTTLLSTISLPTTFLSIYTINSLDKPTQSTTGTPHSSTQTVFRYLILTFCLNL